MLSAKDHVQGSTSRKNPWGQLALKFSDLVTSKSISISEKHRKLAASEKKFGCNGDPSSHNIEL